MDSQKIKAIIVITLSLFVAIYLGITAATAQFEAIAWVLGGLTLIVCLSLGRKIWLLIPFLGSLSLALSIPGRPDTLILAQILVITFSVMLLLLRQLPFRLRFTELEFWILMIVLLVLQVYARNPVGVSLFGGTSVGGRPYAIFVITIASAVVLSGMRVSEKDIRIALRLSILGGITNFGVSVLGRVFPVVGYWTGTNFALNSQANFGDAVDSGQATRRGFLMTAATNIALWISSFRSPLKACLHPVWLPMILLSFAFAMLSGFRSAIALAGLTYLIGLCYRGGLIQVFVSGVIGITGITLLAFVNLAAPLPANIQRSLSFLPGTWDQRYIDDSEGSTEWRVEMWQEALLSERWIHNKVLGDGLGFTARELDYQRSLKEGQLTNTGVSGMDANREGVLAAGDYHSVFVSSVRTVGYIGFFIYFIAIIRTAVHAHHLIKRYRYTTHFSTCLFFGIPAILTPLWLPFSASDFLGVASATMGTIAMLRILETNLPEVESLITRPSLPPGVNGGLRNHPQPTES